MRRTFTLSLLAVTVTFGLTLFANEKPTPELQATMKENAATNGALRMHIMRIAATLIIGSVHGLPGWFCDQPKRRIVPSVYQASQRFFRVFPAATPFRRQ